MTFAQQSANLVEIERVTLTGVLMKAARARVIRKLFLIIFLGLGSAFSFGISVSARAASLTPTDRTSELQSVDLASVDVQPAAAGSIPSKTDQGPTSTQALANSANE